MVAVLSGQMKVVGISMLAAVAGLSGFVVPAAAQANCETYQDERVEVCDAGTAQDCEAQATSGTPITVCLYNEGDENLGLCVEDACNGTDRCEIVCPDPCGNEPVCFMPPCLHFGLSSNNVSICQPLTAFVDFLRDPTSVEDNPPPELALFIDFVELRVDAAGEFAEQDAALIRNTGSVSPQDLCSTLTDDYGAFQLTCTLEDSDGPFVVDDKSDVDVLIGELWESRFQIFVDGNQKTNLPSRSIILYDP